MKNKIIYVNYMKYKKSIKKNKKAINKKVTKKCRGGKVIASGGFGCVFQPALRCKNSLSRPKNSISKLMSKHHGIIEMDHINIIFKKLNKIPNYQNYFVIKNITSCQPNILTEKDLISFEKTCTALPKMNINEENINNNLDELLMISMPDMGLPIDDYIIKNNTYNDFKIINKSLINLLLNGIIPMNKRYIFHSDIKDSNILIDKEDKNMFARLIDWGLTTEYIPNSNTRVPKVWYNRPIQYNMPYSNILFSDIFIKSYHNFLENNIKDIELDKIISFVKEFCVFYFNRRNKGPGHLFLINKIINIITDEKLTKTSIQNTNSAYQISKNTEYVISSYLSNILFEYTTDGNYRQNNIIDRQFNIKEYINKIFIHNIDKWGFVMSYYPFLESFYQNYLIIDDIQKEIFNSICNLFRYAISMDTDIIETSEIVNYLKELDNLNSTHMIKPTDTISINTASSSKGITGNSWNPDDDVKMIHFDN